MDSHKIATELKKSIYHNCWLEVSYENKQGEKSKYWLDVLKIFPSGKMIVDGFHLSGERAPTELIMYFDQIKSAKSVEHSYHKTHDELIKILDERIDQFKFLKTERLNLNIFDYYADCNLYDTTPYQSKYKMIEGIDKCVIKPTGYDLDDSQFLAMLKEVKRQNKKDKRISNISRNVCINLLSIATNHGLYILAYKNLRLDIKNRRLVPDEEITINYEFLVSKGKDIENRMSISKFLAEDDQYLLKDFEKNAKIITDKIMEYAQYEGKVDDSPYIVFLDRNVCVDLRREYSEIKQMYYDKSKEIPAPIKVFLGEPPRTGERKSKPIILYDENKINLDQLRVINKAVKNDVTYVQGPPGTGKTNTILSVILTAFFNDSSILVTSNNNHPMNSVYNNLSKLKFEQTTLPLPIVRLGNKNSVAKALESIKFLYEKCKGITIYEKALSKRKDARAEKTKDLSKLLETYETKLKLIQKKKTLEDIVTNYSEGLFDVVLNIQGYQLNEVNKELNDIGNIDTATAMQYIDKDIKSIYQFLYYKSAEHILKLRFPRNEELLTIVNMPSNTPEQIENKVNAFNKYLKIDKNLDNFTKIFPIVVTTNSSACRLGSAKPHFDLTVMDEASQCNSAVSLVPIIRGRRLLLVGDPQQLNPVILLDPIKNDILRKRFHITDEYDYINQSIYKSFLAVDPVSDEILLSYHYRCSPKIIQFNNKKFYNNKLQICSKCKLDNPLVFIDHKNAESEGKNTSISEIEDIVDYIKKNRKDQSVGIITPFVRQKELINAVLKEHKIENITCGTVHAFQGDEKDVILFSTAITKNTHSHTYEWLKGNTELINVATSRAKNKLVIFSDKDALEKLHKNGEKDDFYELCDYVSSNGLSKVSNNRSSGSRALGYKPYATKTETEFMENLEQALGIIGGERCTIEHNVSIKDVFLDENEEINLFFTGHFDFVVYKKGYVSKRKIPCIAFELNGPEHDDPKQAERDRKKQAIAKEHNFTLISVKNTYSRRYYFIKDILEEYLKNA